MGIVMPTNPARLAAQQELLQQKAEWIKAFHEKARELQIERDQALADVARLKGIPRKVG